MVVVIQIGPETRQHAKVLRDITGVLNRQRSVSVLAKQSSTQPVLAQETYWDSQTSSRNFTTTFQFVSRWIQTRQGTFYSAEDQADSCISRYDAPGGFKHFEIRCLAIQQWIRENRLSVSRVDTTNNTADLFTKLDGLRTQSLAKKLGLRILDGTNGTNGDD